MFSWALFAILMISLSAVFILVAILVGKKASLTLALNSPFECGFSINQSWRSNFSIRFYLLALVFLIFDIELILLYPFLMAFMINISLQWVFVSLLALLAGGLFLEWNKSVMEWTY